MTLRFGTDGIRGLANAELTPELTTAFGRAAATVLGADRFIVGRDTRRSGPLIEAALSAGLAAEGVDVASVGVAPTPALAWLAAADDVPAAVISASHNPYPDNGIKLFVAGGLKPSEEVERRVERELDRLLVDRPAPHPVGEAVGTIVAAGGQLDRYATAVGGTVGDGALDGLTLVVDCANGAAARIAPSVLERLGADVVVLHAEPDGTNINSGCGSTDPRDLQVAVTDAGADAGIAVDGDADRVVAVDGEGRLVDGDHIIAICAIDRHERGLLPSGTVVVTVMTNVGFRLGMAEKGIVVVETPVGDRHVLEAMERGGWILGGEQSGHVIFGDLATTGDGLLTAVQLLDATLRSGRPLSELSDAAMRRLPQELRDVRVHGRDPDVADLVGDEVRSVEASLGDEGRVLVRPSGTEPVVRVMVQAPTAEQAAWAADRLAAAVEAALR